MRHGPFSLAERQALHFLALPDAQQQDIRRKGPVDPNATLWRPGRGVTAIGRGCPHRRSHTDGPWRLLPAAVGARRQSQGSHRNCPQDRSAVLHTLRHGMAYADPGASYYEERYRVCVLANLQRRAKSAGYVLQEAPASG